MDILEDLLLLTLDFIIYTDGLFCTSLKDLNMITTGATGGDTGRSFPTPKGLNVIVYQLNPLRDCVCVACMSRE